MDIFKKYFYTFLSVLFLFLGLNGVCAASDISYEENEETVCGFTPDTSIADNCFDETPDEGNISFSNNLSTTSHNLRVNVRRKTSGSSWDGFFNSAYSINKHTHYTCSSHNNSKDCTNPSKEYFIQLRKFLI